MSHTPLTTASPSSKFRSIFDAALKDYQKKTKNDLLAHQLTAELKSCESAAAILAVLNKQYHVQQFIRSQTDGDSSKQWLSATLTVLCAFSGALGEGVGLVFSPAKVIFAGVCVLLTAAKDVDASQEVLVDLFTRIENFFKRFETYASVRLPDGMTELIIKIMVEVLGILAITTKWIKQGFAKKFVKKLLGRTDIEDALKKLENLSRDEALMATAQVLKVTHEGIDVGRETNVAIHRIENYLGDLTRDQARKGFREWLSPPDPTINYNTARKAYHDGTATWFTQGEIFEHWKESGSERFLWVHGKPGSGKSILSSAIIHDARCVSNSGAPYVIYFFFDFKDEGKQDSRALLSSLLVQLCDQFDSCFKVLFDMYSSHNRGEQEPSEEALLQCLKDMLLGSGQSPIYLIVDALDECPDTSKELGTPPSRQMVLDVVKELVELRLSNLHICVASRPEADIRSVLEPLASFKVSLHDQDGQKEDIANYVRSVVDSDKEQGMRRWKRDVKDLVIKMLSEKANGMFRWVVCQLETLRKCPARNVPRVLSELPKSLDETYLRVLKGIDKEDREDVYRLLQCLVVSIRPLRVEELAEVLAVDFEDAEGIPKLNPDWRWEDEEQSLQAACSSLVAVVDTGRSRVVQFSHFSVKEFLTSDRLADSSEGVSCYYVSLEAAHLVLAQACLGVLLHLDDVVDMDDADEDSWNDSVESSDHYSLDTKDSSDDTEDSLNGDNVVDGFPLARYAARHWVAHAQFGNVSSCIRKAMEHLFDPDKPHFSAWLQLHDIDTYPSSRSALGLFSTETKRKGTPLYYATLCGFHDLAEHLIVKHPKYINAYGGRYVAPLVGALTGNHFQIAQILHQHGADLDIRGKVGSTPLMSASAKGHPELVEWLLSHGADVNSRDQQGLTPLHFASINVKRPDVARILLKHNADPRAPAHKGHTPLCTASDRGHLDMVRLLLELGVDVNPRDQDSWTPLHWASRKGHLEVARMLLEHGADIEAENDRGQTAFQLASMYGHGEMMKFLSEHGAKHGGSSES